MYKLSNELSTHRKAFYINVWGFEVRSFPAFGLKEFYFYIRFFYINIFYKFEKIL